MIIIHDNHSQVYGLSYKILTKMLQSFATDLTGQGVVLCPTRFIQDGKSSDCIKIHYCKMCSDEAVQKR